MTPLTQLMQYDLIRTLDDDFGRWVGETSCGFARTYLFYGTQQRPEQALAMLAEYLETSGWILASMGDKYKEYSRGDNEALLVRIYTPKNFVDVWGKQPVFQKDTEVLGVVETQYSSIVMIQADYYLPDRDSCQ